MDIQSRLAGRVRAIGASGIRKIFDLAANLKDPLDFSIGQPHYDVHPEVKQAAVDAIEGGFNRYTASGGIPELKEGIAAREPELAGSDRTIMITSGVSGGIMLAILALVEPGDEVLIPDPGFVSYKHVVRMAEGVPVFFDTYPDFRLHPEHIRAAITPRTKLLILNSPCNPTGMVYSAGEIQTAGEICREHGIIPLSDETYRSFAYDGEARSVLEHCPETIVLRGFSKDYAMTGWRMGYASAPAPLIEAMTKLQQFSFVNAPSFAQKACLTALRLNADEAVRDYRRKRDMVYNGLKDRFDIVRPEGAFYCFPRSPWGTGMDFVTAAIEKNLLIVPGGAFSQQDTHFRISYAVSNAALEAGIEILNNLAVAGA